MSSIIKSVSLNYDEDTFLKEYNLSPTQLLKEKIWEMKGMIAKVVRDRMSKMANTITFLNEELLRANEKNDILEEKITNTAQLNRV